MSKVDELVEGWFLHKWTSGGGFYPRYERGKHGVPSELSIISMDGQWECGCYSEYTRDDQEKLVAIVKGIHGKSFEVSYGTWGGFPELINQLINFGELEDVCSIEAYDAENDS